MDRNRHAEQKNDLPVPQGKAYSTVTIDGQPLEVVENAQKHDDAPVRLYDRTQRAKLKPKDRQAFVKYVTTWVLNKNNKLALHSLGTEDSVHNIRNLQSQLKKLRRHLESYDVRDVFYIVTPTEVDKSNNLVSDTDVYDLFRDYQRLHVTQVANSNAW